jgi:hypothetical protein
MTRATFTLMMLLLAPLSACTHARPEPPSLSGMLRLDHEPVGVIRVGSEIQIPSAIRNVSPDPIEVCTNERIVSACLEMPDGSKWPIVLGGTVLHARCAVNQPLQPGEQLMFSSEGGVSRNLNAGPATLHLSIGISSPPGSPVVSITSEEAVTLVKSP